MHRRFSKLSFLSLLFLPFFVSANGLLDRAHDQYRRRGYDEAGIEAADAARSNYDGVVKYLKNVDGEYARARLLQASHFLVLANSRNKKFLLQDGIGQGMQGYLYFEKNFGRAPFDNSSLNERGRKIYADFLFWKGMVFAEWIRDQGGGFQNEWSKIRKDMQLIIEKGYGCLNDGGAYRVLENYEQAYACTLIPSQNSKDSFNWNGWNVLTYAEKLKNSGRQTEAIAVLKKFISQPAEQLSLDFIPENQVAQKQAVQKLKEWGAGQPIEVVPGEFVIQTVSTGKNSYQIQKTSARIQQIFKDKLKDELKEIIQDDIFVVRRFPYERLEYSIQKIQEELSTSIQSFNLQSAVRTLVEPNYIYHISGIPNDSQFGQLWGMQNLGQLDSKGIKGFKGVDIQVVPAWNITTGNRDMIVGVIDTGVDFSQADLRENAWVNEAELHGKPGVDDDGNGYVDDINGYDFYNDTAVIQDDHGHGTHVAGIIAGRGNDGAGIAGINWNIRIMSIKFLGAHGGGDLVTAIKAVRYAVKMKAVITNNSWGSFGSSDILKNIIQEASDAGQLFVAAAGNSGENADLVPEYPAGYAVENVISVASINNRGQLSNFSNYGPQSVHIAAPGENILSTTPNGFASWSGTSMAAPHVAGVAALVWGHEPNLKMQELKSRLLKTARPLASLTNKILTPGIVNAYHALTNTVSAPDPYDPAKWESLSWKLSSEHSYQNNIRFEYDFYVAQANALSLHFAKFQLESQYDKLYFFDEKNHLLGVWTGIHGGEYSPLAEGEHIRIQLVTDQFLNDYGFDIDTVVFHKGEFE